MAPPPISEPSRIAIEDAFSDALNALVASPALDEPHTWHVAYLGQKLLRMAGTKGREAAEELRPSELERLLRAPPPSVLGWMVGAREAAAGVAWLGLGLGLGLG